MKNYLILLAVAASFAFTSCGDDDEIVPPTKTELITNKNWVMSAETMTMNGITEDTYSNKAACEKDDFVNFSSNNTLTYDQGATKCDPNMPQTETRNWTFTNSETKLKIGLNGVDAEFNMVELTANKLVFSKINQENVNGTLTDVTWIHSFTAQ